MLLTISSLTLSAAVVTIAFIDRVSIYPWRVSFSLASTLLAGGALSVGIYLDGGLDSPLIVLIALPVMSAALALPAKEVTICGVVAFVEFGVVALTDSHMEATTSDIAALSAFLIGTVMLSGAPRSIAHASNETEIAWCKSSASKRAQTRSLVV